MKAWPRLKTYTGENLRNIALPLGGIGTGTVSLGGRGDLRDWEIMNTPAKTFTPLIPEMKNVGPFFALYTESQGVKKSRCLEGPLDRTLYEAPEGSLAPNSGLPRFREAVFHAAYPLAEVQLSDNDIPLKVTLRAFNPLVLGNVEKSSLPCASLSFHLHNYTKEIVNASVCATLINHIGCDGRERAQAWGSRLQMKGMKNNYNESFTEDEKTGINFLSEGVDKLCESYGTMTLTASGGNAAGVRNAWKDCTWGDSLLDFWDEFSGSGEITDRKSFSDNPNETDQKRETVFQLFGSVARKISIAPSETVTLSFLLTWHFPNRKSWTPNTDPNLSSKELQKVNIVGNHYTTLYKNSFQAAKEIFPRLKSLEEETVHFVNAFVSSPLPLVVKESALFNLSTLRSQTCFRTPDGHFFGWEGVHNFEGSCYGNCTHVWNYEQTTPFLFAELAQSMRELEFSHASKKDGNMAFRVNLPLASNLTRESFPAAADGQMGAIMKLYREWQLSGDDEFLKKCWPRAKNVLSYAWLPDSWDADKDGVMEGCQHNTMDVEYYGPNPLMQGWYLGALLAGSKMANHLGENDFAAECFSLFEKGREWTDANLFNGEYYEQKIVVNKNIRPEQRLNMGSDLSDTPDLQIGTGCIIDQLVGQYMAHVCGLGYILKKENVLTALRSIVKYNSKDSFHDHFNHLRCYVLGDEAGVLMASYPHGGRATRPFPYYNEVMTGFEHTLAAHLFFEGMTAEGLKVVENIRERYDGKKRSPFSEAECGHHYARAMAAWAEVIALSGFRYDGVTKTLYLKEQKSEMFFSTGTCWGTFRSEQIGDDIVVYITAGAETLKIDRVIVDGKKACRTNLINFSKCPII